MDSLASVTRKFQSQGEIVLLSAAVKYLEGVPKKGGGFIVLTNRSLAFWQRKKLIDMHCYSWFSVKTIELAAESCHILVDGDPYAFAFDRNFAASFSKAVETAIASQFLPQEIDNLLLSGLQIKPDPAKFNLMTRLISLYQTRKLTPDRTFLQQLAETFYTREISLDLTQFQQPPEIEDIVVQNLHLYPYLQSLKISIRNGMNLIFRYVKSANGLSRLCLVGPFGKMFRQFLDIAQESHLTHLYFQDAEFTKEQLDCLHEKLVHLDLEELGINNSIREEVSGHFYTSFLTTQLFDHVLSLNLDGTHDLNIESLLRKVESVTTLSIARCNLEVPHVLELLRKHGITHLRTLDLSGNNSSRPINPNSSLPKSIKCLKLNNIKWGQNTLISLLKVVLSAKKTGKIKLCLSHARVFTAEWRDIFSMLAFLPGQSLSALEWDGNPVDRRLFEFLKRQNVVELSLSECIHATFIAPAYDLAELIRASNRLSVLKINSNSETFIGSAVCAILEASIGHPSLVTLQFNNSQAGLACMGFLKAFANIPSRLQTVEFDGLMPLLDPAVYLRDIEDITSIADLPRFRCPVRDLTALMELSKITVSQYQAAIARFSVNGIAKITEQTQCASPDEADFAGYTSHGLVQSVKMAKSGNVPVVIDDVDTEPLDFSMTPAKPVFAPWRKSASISQSEVSDDPVSKLKFKWDLSEELLFPPLPIPEFDPVIWENLSVTASLQNLTRNLGEAIKLSN